MEEENKETGEVEKNEGTGKVVTQTNQNEGEAEKLYTQEDFNALDRKLKKKYDEKYKSIDLKKYNEWLEIQKTEEQKASEKEIEYQKAISEKEEAIKENKVFRAGVGKEDVEFVAFKVSKMEGDFDENLAKFLKQNPKYLGIEETKYVKKVGSSMSMGGKITTNQNETNQIMNDLIRSARD